MRDIETRNRAVLLATVVLIGAGFLFAAGSGTVAADSVDEDNLTIDRLSDTGERFGDSPPGVRSDGTRIWQMHHWPSDEFFSDPGSHVDGEEEFVGPETIVDRTEVWVTTTTQRDITQEVHVVYWEPVEEGNTTVAEVHHHEQQVITWDQGMPYESIDLRDDIEDVEVTVWVAGEEDLRWGFQYDPVDTAMPADTVPVLGGSFTMTLDTVGDAVLYGLINFLLPVLGVGICGAKLSRMAAKRAGTGPGIPWWIWGLVVVFAIGILAVVQYNEISTIIANVPWLGALAIGGFLAIVQLEQSPLATRELLFLRADAHQLLDDDGEPIQSPSGKLPTSVDANSGYSHVERAVTLPDGSTAVVKPGILPFIARLFSSPATIPSTKLETSIKDLGDHDEWILIDPKSTTIIEHTPERLGFRVPRPDALSEWPESLQEWGKAVGYLIGIAVLVLLGIGALGMIASVLSWFWAAIALVVLLPLCVTAKPGAIDFDPASEMQRRAWVTTINRSREMAAAQTVDEARKRDIKREADRELEKQDIEAEADWSMASFTFANPRQSDSDPESGESQETTDGLLQNIDDVETDDDTEPAGDRIEDLLNKDDEEGVDNE